MSSDPVRSINSRCFALAHSVVEAIRTTSTCEELAALMVAVTREMNFRHYALIHHDDPGTPEPGRVDLKEYPCAITEHLFGESRFRDDPVIRGCAFAGGAFLWSDLPRIINLNRRDRASFELGARAGLNEGITVPYVRLGDRMGSCTFAGMRRPERAHIYLGVAQMIGVFAFQAARRLVMDEAPPCGEPAGGAGGIRSRCAIREEPLLRRTFRGAGFPIVRVIGFVGRRPVANWQDIDPTPRALEAIRTRPVCVEALAAKAKSFDLRKKWTA